MVFAIIRTIGKNIIPPSIILLEISHSRIQYSNMNNAELGKTTHMDIKYHLVCEQYNRETYQSPSCIYQEECN